MEINTTLSATKNALWDIFFTEDVKNLSIKLLILVFLCLSLSYLSFDRLISWNVETFKKWVNKIASTETLISWDQKNFKWYDYQIASLNEFIEQEEKVVYESWKLLLEKLNSAVPEELANYKIAKFFEDLFLSLSSREDNIVLNSIQVWSIVEKEIETEVGKLDYVKYPVTISFSATDDKFQQILDLIQISWSLNEKYYYKWSPIPVMTVSSVNLNFNENEDKWWVTWRNLQFFMYSYLPKNKEK